jgi:hypothetical protein
VFAASATGTAFAWVTSDVAPTKAATTVSATADQSATAAANATFKGISAVISTTRMVTVKPASPVAATKPAATVATAAAPAAPAAKPSKAAITVVKPAVKKIAATASVPRSITIDHYVNKPGSQSAIDKCNLVLWTRSPLWLAGHNWCGYQWMAYVPTGTNVTVTHGLAAGTYVVTDHIHLSRQSGDLPTLNADLVLQTCIGNGTGLTLLSRV